MRRAHSRWLRRQDGLRGAAAAQRGAALRASIRNRCRMRNLHATSGTASRDGLTGPQRVSSYAGLPIYSYAYSVAKDDVIDGIEMQAPMRPILLAIAIWAIVLCPAAHAFAGGWYLLVPEQVSVQQAMDGHPKLQDDWLIAKATLSLEQPLTKWEHVRSFDTAAECEKERRDRFVRAQGLARRQDRRFLQRAFSWLNSSPTEDKLLTPWDLVGHQVLSEDTKKKHPKLQEFLKGLRELHSLCIASDDGRLHRP